MLEVTIRRGDVEKLAINGTPSDITIETMALLHTLYRQLEDTDEAVALGFKSFMIENIREIFDGPKAVTKKLNSMDIEETARKVCDDEAKRLKAERKEKLNELAELLKDMPEDLRNTIKQALEESDGDEHK